MNFLERLNVEIALTKSKSWLIIYGLKLDGNSIAYFTSSLTDTIVIVSSGSSKKCSQPSSWKYCFCLKLLRLFWDVHISFYVASSFLFLQAGYGQTTDRTNGDFCGKCKNIVDIAYRQYLQRNAEQELLMLAEQICFVLPHHFSMEVSMKVLLSSGKFAWL